MNNHFLNRPKIVKNILHRFIIYNTIQYNTIHNRIYIVV